MRVSRIEIEEPRDIENDNIEVEVTLTSGESYWATFLTIENIRHLFEKNEGTGEHGGGTYLPVASNMIIVKRLTTEIIHRTIDDLIASTGFGAVFVKLAPLSPGDDMDTK